MVFRELHPRQGDEEFTSMGPNPAELANIGLEERSAKNMPPGPPPEAALAARSIGNAIVSIHFSCFVRWDGQHGRAQNH